MLGWPVIGTALRVQERYTEDAADNFAASIGFFGFLSLFPLILLGLSVLGYVLRGDVDLQARVVDAVQDAVPGLGQALGEQSLGEIVQGIRDNAGSLAITGLASLLFTGLKVIAGAQRALAVVFRMELPTGLAARAQQLLALVGLGLLALLGSAVGGSVGVDLGDGPRGLAISLGLTVLAFLVDLVLFLVAYRLLSPDPGAPPWRVLLPGAVFAAVAWVALKAGGASLIAGGGGGDATAPAFASAGALLVLLYLAGRVFMYGAELTAVRNDLGGDGEADGSSLVEPRPVEDVAPPPIELAKLTGLAAVLALVAKVADRD